ncbi:MAG: two-component regulator propeller domain-containing protein, partial [Syntrophothermus sp.]
MGKNSGAAACRALSVVFFMVIYFFSAEAAFPQETHSRFEHISIEQGLSQSSVNCIIQDHSGFIWIGTADGLNRYDGYSFKVFRSNPLQKKSISDNAVTSMYVDAGGHLLVGTLLGHLNIYNSDTEEFTRISLDKILSPDSAPESFPDYEYPMIYARYNDNTITSVYSDNKGILWLGTWGRGLIRYDLKKNDLRVYTHSPSDKRSISSSRIINITGDSKNNLWVCTFGGGLDKIPLNNSEADAG